jgi:rsbT co-antagonist protein RsbR
MVAELREQVALIQKQQEDILALSAPVLQVWDGIVAIPIVGALTPDRADEMTERVLAAVSKEQASFAILDLTGVDAVDTATADSLLKVVRSLQLLGTQGVIAGLRPRVAQTVVAMGMDLGNIRTFGTLRDALKDCIRRMG